MTAPRKPQVIDLLTQVREQGLKVEISSPETPEELQSRLRREEAEDSHKHRISLIVHCFGLGMVAIGLGVSAFVVIARDPKTGLPDRALGIIAVIISAAFGYMTGKATK